MKRINSTVLSDLPNVLSQEKIDKGINTNENKYDSLPIFPFTEKYITCLFVFLYCKITNM